MMRRLVSWAVAALVVYFGYQAYAAYQNPWSVPVPRDLSVLSSLPVAHDGCATSKDCFHD